MENSGRPLTESRSVPEQVALVVAYELFSAAASKYFDGTLSGKLVVGCGMGQFGGAQALAAPMNGAAFLGIDADSDKIKQRVKSGYCDVMVNDLDEALRILKNAVRKREVTSVGLCAAPGNVVAVMGKRGVVPDLLIDQTGANDSAATQTEGLFALQALGSKIFAADESFHSLALGKHSQKIGDAVGEFIRPRLAQGFAPLQIVAAAGQAADIRRVDALALEIFAADESVTRWVRLVQKRTRFQNPPARAYWLGGDQQTALRNAIDDLAPRGGLKSPVTIASYDFDSAP
jgi:urocanate hydratase